MEHLRKSAFQQYSILVDAVINNHISGQKEIEHIMDGLSDFGDHAEFFELYRKLLHTAVASGSWCGAERQQRGDSGSVLI